MFTRLVVCSCCCRLIITDRLLGGCSESRPNKDLVLEMDVPGRQFIHNWSLVSSTYKQGQAKAMSVVVCISSCFLLIGTCSCLDLRNPAHSGTSSSNNSATAN
jgi:hypothetical protein